MSEQQETSRRPWWRFWGRSADETTPGSRVSAVYAVETTAVAGGLAATIVYAVAGPNASLSVVSASVMIAVAALGSGVLIGILFGVPRTTAGAERPTGGDAAGPAPGAVSTVSAVGAVGANTNLEQISDWLTKILVGVGLTQFAAIKREASQLFHALAPALGDGSGRTSFAGSVVIYFFVVGFLTGWLYARLRLGLLMSNTDALLELARRADRAGDTETARTARERANNQLALGTDASPITSAGTTDVILQYNRLRGTPRGARRTSQMSEVVRQARRLRETERFTPLDVLQLFNEDTEGSRIVALALMEDDSQLVDFPLVLNAIKDPRSAFEQYHALTVASLVATSLPADAKTQLQDALESDDVRGKWEGDSGRAVLAASILATIKRPTT